VSSGECRKAAATILPKTNATHERPMLVTSIVVVALLIAIAPWLTFFLVGSGMVSVMPAARAYVTRLTLFDYSFLALGSVVTIASALSLFLLKKAAAYLFGAALAFYVLGIWLYATAEQNAGLGSYWNAQELLKFGFYCATIFYCGRLLNRGVLS
jgi:hypothetical protein